MNNSSMFPIVQYLLTIAFISSVSASVPCSSVHDIFIPGAKVLSITGIKRSNVDILAGLTADKLYPAYSNLSFCNITITLTHPGANDTVLIEVWLPPPTNWNGRFQAAGGGGYSVGFNASLGPAVGNGYAVAYSDGGNMGYGFEVLAQALLPTGEVNWALLENYSSRSIHDMTVASKEVIAAYYGKNAKYSYFNRCSGGGRQGYIEAQKYPTDFDGIMAASPAINTPKTIMSMQWPYVVMQNDNTVPSQCVFQAFINASFQLCDGLDGVKDGLISDVAGCQFDPPR